jgi:pseudoazurin
MWMKICMAGAIAVLATNLAPANAAEIEVKMLNKGSAGTMVFEPAFLRIAPGDSVRFVPTDKGHDAASIDTMMPDGAVPFAGKMNQEIVIAFDKAGVYGVKCRPHYGLGMVALIVVGEPTNIDAARAIKQTGKAKQVFAKLFAELDKTLASR